MASYNQNPLQIIGKQIQSLMPIQSFNAQEKPDGAKVIETLESVPEIFQEFFQSHLSEGEPFPYTVLIPTFEATGDRITGKLVCVIEHAFYVLEQKDNSLRKICYPIDEINYVEVIHWPLDLLFKINGLTNLGIPSTSVFGCSTPRDHIFAPLMQRIRLRLVSLNEKAHSRHMEKLDRWNDLNTYVVDMARHCLMPGETVIESILQPETRPSIFSPDRAFRGTKYAAHIYILTDKELMMIREDPSVGKREKHGSICTFVPLSKINSLALNQEKNQISISVHISSGDVYEAFFDASLENDVNQFMDRTRELMPKERLYVRD